MKRLVSEYKKRKNEIKRRLKEFSAFRGAKDEDIFSELCFCLLTPQSKAVYCDKAVKELKCSGLLFRGSKNNIKEILRGNVRFHNKKAEYLVGARELLGLGGKLNIKNKLDTKDTFKAREWLVRNIKGLGYKEASHFLRNIGLGKDMAIIDRHILKNMKRYGAIRKIPASVTKGNYINMEDAMRNFSKKVKIPMEELDLLFWSSQTGFVFK
ncbi:MAG: N-glycosylase/DNA lyase [Candidatus Omnitrophica bacterium]|nr:N-glycosylase/DNA lyase [Candidatus Omnitrophota bacterium]